MNLTVLLSIALIPCSLSELNTVTEAWETCNNLYPFLISYWFSRSLNLFSSRRDDDDDEITHFSGTVQLIQRTVMLSYFWESNRNQPTGNGSFAQSCKSLSLSLEPPKLFQLDNTACFCDYVLHFSLSLSVLVVLLLLHSQTHICTKLYRVKPFTVSFFLIIFAWAFACHCYACQYFR